MRTKRIAYLGIFIALAFVFSYIEFLLPIHLGIQAAKLGLANLVIMVALYLLTEQDAFVLSMIRVLLVGFSFGNMTMMMYSFAGALVSFLVMLLAKKTKLFSIVGVSVLGGVFHNIGQLLVAIWMVKMGSLVFYLPALLLVGTISGVVIGLLAGIVTKHLKKLVNL